MEAEIVLNIDQSKQQTSHKRKVAGSRAKRIGSRRKEKKKQWKERLKSTERTSEVSGGEGKDLTSVDGGGGRCTNSAVKETLLGKRMLDMIDQHGLNSRQSVRRKLSDDSPHVKKKKTGHAGSAVISSLFRCNPDIPKVESCRVTKTKEDIFTSDSFKDLPLHPFMLKLLEDQLQLHQMTAVQKQAIPTLLEGHDCLVKSQTGSGKTLSFAIPIVQHLQSLNPHIHRSHGLHAVVVVPTRELALQCFEVFLQLVKPFIRIVPGILIGGEKRKAEKARLSKGINILVCTPGRLVDHLNNTASLTLDKVQFLILDEADRLSDMGYEKNIAEIVTALSNRSQCRRQTVLLSATLSEGVERLAGISLENPKQIFLSDNDVTTTGQKVKAKKNEDTKSDNCSEIYTVPDNLKQYFVITPCKLRLVTLAAFILWKCQLSAVSSKMVVFMSTQDAVAFYHQLLVEVLCQSDGVAATGKHELSIFKLHGDMQQKDRTEVFHTFSESKHGLLLCTDVAARGLDLAHVQWIVQYSAPSQEADYVHRIGRTARAGLQGQSLLFLMPSEVEYINILNKHNISLEEMKMKRILTCLVPVIADINTQQELGEKRNKPRDLIESATYLQMKFESVIQAKQDLLSQARRGYQSFIRAYATYPSHLKTVFRIRDLHLGHVAKAFGLREAPGGIGDRAGPLEKKKNKTLRPSVKKVKKHVSEFDSGLSGKKKHKNLGPRKKKKRKQ